MSQTPQPLADERDFRGNVADTLRALLDQIDEIDSDDLEPRLTEGNLSVQFESGGTFILSQQTPTRELWLSANLTAWHFRFDGQRWVERDTGEPLAQVLSTLFSGKIKDDIRLVL